MAPSHPKRPRKIIRFVIGWLLLCGCAGAGFAQSFVNQGLVGVGRISANDLDVGGQDTLGGFSSGLNFDPTSWSRTGTSGTGYTYAGRFYAVPDRGVGSTVDYHPRLLTFTFTFTPYYGSGVVAQTQMVATNTALTVWTYGSGTLSNFTGADANNTAITNFPQSTTGSVGTGHRSLDPEGIARAADGTFYICDEYGPNLYHFSSAGNLLNTLVPPAAFVGKVGSSYPRANSYTEQSDPNSGRYGGRGFEGISLTPDGKQLVGLLESPLVQDGGSKGGSINTRIVVYNVDPNSAQFNTLVGEYIYQLSLNGNDPGSTAKNTPVNELLAINNTQFLIIEHDSRGWGGDSGAFLYKRVNLANIASATNLAGSGYDLEKGAPGQINLPETGNPAGVTPVTKTALVDLLDGAQLGKFGLNTNTTSQNQNTLPEAWEGLALVPVGDPVATNDYFLIVGNDNNFSATKVIVNGVQVDSVSPTVDNLLLVYRVTLPGATVPQPASPTATTGAADLLTSASARLNATVDPNSLATLAQFQYGTTTSYGLLTALQNTGSSNAPQTLTAALSGLNPATLYHYRVVATNLLGTVFGADQSLTTLTSAPTVITAAASPVTSYSATFNGMINPNGLTAIWWFDLGTNTSYGFSSVPQTMTATNAAVVVSLPVTGLTPGMTYHYRLSATNAIGSSVGGDQILVMNPFIDSDGDGLPDDYEIAHGLDPHNAADASVDSAGDGLSNLQEYLAGTDPHNPAAAFKITAITINGADFVITFNSVFGKAYQVQKTSNPSNLTWPAVTGGERLPGTGDPLQITDIGAALQPVGIYRVQLVP